LEIAGPAHSALPKFSQGKVPLFGLAEKIFRPGGRFALESR
jgi:hypothetical protein